MENLEEEAHLLLEKIRKDKRPTKRGILLCGEALGKCIQFGWKQSQLDALEIIYWSIHDGNGDLIKKE